MIYQITSKVTGEGDETTGIGDHELGTDDPDIPRDVIGIKDAEMITPRGAKLRLSASYALKVRNLSLIVMEEGVHILTAAAHWDKVTPCFGVRLRTGEFLHLYFKMTPE